MCGSASTTLEDPTDITALYRVPNYPLPLTVDSSFTSTNPTCPVTSHTLTSGSGSIILTDNAASDTPSFKLEMEESASKVSDTYSYTVTATAEGEATGTYTNTMTIGEVCSGTVEDNFAKSYAFDIPSTSSNTENFPSASTNYISLDTVSTDYFTGTSIDECYQTFTYTIQDPHSTTVAT